MIDPSQMAAVKDFANAGGAIVAALIGFGGGRWQRRNEVNKLKLEREKLQAELNKGTGRDPGARQALYQLYVIRFDQFYGPAEGSASEYGEWSKRYSEISTQVKLLGLEPVCKAVEAADAHVQRIGRESFTNVPAAGFERAWYDAVKSNQTALDMARKRVLDSMRADIGPKAPA